MSEGATTESRLNAVIMYGAFFWYVLIIFHLFCEAPKPQPIYDLERMNESINR